MLRAHVLLLALLAAACDGGQPGPSNMPVETSKSAAPAPTEPAAAAEPALFTSKDGLVEATPWPIDYARYQDPRLNNFFSSAPEIDISPQHSS